MEIVYNSNLDSPDHPVFEPERWNKNKYIRKSHNCYSYALNIIDRKLTSRCKHMIKRKKTKKIKGDCGVLKPQPGAYSKTIKSRGKYNCKKVTYRMVKDNPVMKPIAKGVPCPLNYYLIAMVCIPDGSDYHFYRQDASGLWSHKNGGNVARNTDDSGNIIYDPEKADRGRYSILCGYYTVPNDSHFKRMSSTR